ncbi:unnamed protein product [Pleuronectes platessa]|uniref:Uncharacterized protein n=1 Tax=Pleuronectes platessa TaxID=8262 RepID=A0A9N7VMM0_PLEPL|nr:unnamed protein product [Pleuronectes platessa]
MLMLAFSSEHRCARASHGRERGSAWFHNEAERSHCVSYAAPQSLFMLVVLSRISLAELGNRFSLTSCVRLWLRRESGSSNNQGVTRIYGSAKTKVLDYSVSARPPNLPVKDTSTSARGLLAPGCCGRKTPGSVTTLCLTAPQLHYTFKQLPDVSDSRLDEPASEAETMTRHTTPEEMTASEMTANSSATSGRRSGRHAARLHHEQRYMAPASVVPWSRKRRREPMSPGAEERVSSTCSLIIGL